MSGNEAYYGNFIDANGNATPTYARLIDACFTWVDSTFGWDSFRGTGKMEFHKLLKLQTLADPNATMQSYTIPWDEFYVRAALAKSIWDACKIPYSWVAEGDGFGYGVLDRETFVVCSTIDTRADPDSDYAFWNKLVGTGQLIDAATGAPFPYPVPRSAFLAVRDEAWAKAIERLVNDFSSSLVVKHHSYHLRFEKLYTNTGQVPCQTCLRGINGTRHRCKTCFDWSECGACHDKRVERWSNYAVIGMKSFAGGWNLGMQLDGL